MDLELLTWIAVGVAVLALLLTVVAWVRLRVVDGRLRSLIDAGAPTTPERERIDALEAAGVLADGARTVAFSYIGTEITWPIYWHGALGRAKVDLDALRAELTRLLDGNDKWDGEVNGIVVTEARASGMQVRALVSAANSGEAWDLRCEIREGLLAFVNEHYPESLPRLRAELVGESTPLPANRAQQASA